jgi:hypothetical protein
MSTIERQIENLLARVRELELQLSAVQASAVRPASWIRAPRSADILIKTPSGGIAAATGSGPYSWGLATCEIISDVGEVLEEEVAVNNIVNRSIAGSVPGKASRVGGIYVIDVASCGSGG